MRKLVKGYLAQYDNPSKRLVFQYNPEMFEDNIEVTYRAISSPGMSWPIYQYIGGEPRYVEFTLFLDHYNRTGENQVRKTINFLHSFLPYRKDRFHAPPELLFSFGWFVKRCILSSLKVRYTMFDSNLQPIRAEVDIRLEILG